jgi:hypothetical protein
MTELQTENVNVNRWSNRFRLYATHPDGRTAYICEYRAPGWDTLRVTIYRTKLSTDTHPWPHSRHPRTVGVTKKNGWIMENNNAEST